MKELFSRLHNLMLEKKHGFFFLLWFAVHLGLPALLGVSLFVAEPLSISTQIMDLLPQTDMAKIAEVESVLTERNSRETIILFSSPVFEKAKDSAVSFYNNFKNNGEIESASLLFDSNALAEIADFFFKHRFVIAGIDTVELLESGGAQEIVMDALTMAYGAINYIPLDNLDKDPFLLTERGIREFVSSSIIGAAGGINVKDDVLTVQKDDIWFVILRMTLTPEAVSVVNIKNNIVAEFYAAADLIKETEPELEMFFSGAPFHSYESASNAQKEITIIGVVSMSFILLLFLLIFRSPIPVIFSILDILISLFLGTVTTFLIFREIHVFTFIFGTVLIGICIDYSIHYFIQWRGNPTLKNSSEIRSHISKSMIMCFISSIICYSAILFASLPIFKQFAVFAIAGLFSSFLTAYCIYPLLKLPDENKRHFKFPEFKLLHNMKILFSPAFRIICIVILAAISITILCFNPEGVKINNDLSTFYTPPPHLMKSEMQTAIVLDQGSAPLYYIVSGNSAEETLRNEERLSLRLKEEISKGNISSFLGTTMSIPSAERQKRTYNAMSALLPLAGLQYENLGFPQNYEQVFYDEYTAGNNYCLPENAPSWTGLSNLWIGEVSASYYSCLFLFHVKDRDIFTSIAEEYDFVHLINMEEIINNDLDSLTKTIVFFFFTAFFIVVVIISFVYPLKDSIKICSVPVLVVLAVLAVLAVLKIPLGFLPIAAAILVFGLGIDFVLYMSGKREGKYHYLTQFAVFLSFLTTTLSFGLLSFSSFAPVYIFGLTVAVGLAAAFVFTMLFQGKVQRTADT